MGAAREPKGRASEVAIEAATRQWFSVRDALDAAHDPALGLDRSVCLREVVEALQRRAHEPGVGISATVAAASFLQRHFTGEGS